MTIYKSIAAELLERVAAAKPGTHAMKTHTWQKRPFLVKVELKKRRNPND